MALFLVFPGSAFFTLVLFLGRLGPPEGNTAIGVSRPTWSLELQILKRGLGLVWVGSCALPQGQSPQNGMRRLQRGRNVPQRKIFQANHDWAPEASLLQGCIIEQLLGQVHVGQRHAALQGVLLGVLSLQQPQAALPLVAGDLATREAVHRYDHGNSTASGWSRRLSHHGTC